MVASRILGIIVTYFPTSEGLLPLLQSLDSQVTALLIIDNTSREDDRITQMLGQFGSGGGDLRVLRVGKNIGIGAAQNIGLEVALAEQFDCALLCDQDSIPAAGMVAALCDCRDRLRAQGISVGCVCPEYFDQTTRQAFPFQIKQGGRVFYSTVSGESARPWIEIITTISSGTLIPCNALQQVGLMREEFFIDHVDTEWCHRARARGFRLFGTALTRLEHRLGDAPFSVWYFGWHKHSEYSPTRLYYRFRNFVLLCQLPHVPLRWTIRASWYWAGNLYAHTLFSRSKLANAKAIVHGLWDGILGKSGRLGS